MLAIVLFLKQMADLELMNLRTITGLTEVSSLSLGRASVKNDCL